MNSGPYGRIFIQSDPLNSSLKYVEILQQTKWGD